MLKPRFHIGDEVKCIDHRRHDGSYLLCLSLKKRYFVVKEVTWPDGSQSLWVKTRYSENIRGPVVGYRFQHKGGSLYLEYDPTQQGDTEDDI